MFVQFLSVLCISFHLETLSVQRPSLGELFFFCVVYIFMSSSICDILLSMIELNKVIVKLEKHGGHRINLPSILCTMPPIRIRREPFKPFLKPHRYHWIKYQCHFFKMWPSDPRTYPNGSCLYSGDCY